MTDFPSGRSDATAYAADEHVQVISFLATDDELLVLLEEQPGALLKLYPEGEDELSRGVANAVRRSLVARRAAIVGDDDGGGRLELLQPWAGLVEQLSGGSRFCRITIDGDDRAARLVLVGDDALFTVDRDPSGIHTITISIPELAEQLVTERFARAPADVDGIAVDLAGGEAPVEGSSLRLAGTALAEGRRLLDQGADDEAESLLGAAAPVLRKVHRTFRVETMQLTGTHVHGSEFDVLDAGDAGWVQVAYAEDDGADVILTPLDDATLRAVLVEALAS